MYPLTILAIEDNDADFLYIQELLHGENFTFIHRHSLKEALSCEEQDYDLILLDLSLPDGQGLKTVEALNEVIKSKPIVILTGLVDEDRAIEAVKRGVQDYILKEDMSARALNRAISYAFERKQYEVTTKRLAVLEEHDELMATLSHDLKNPVVAANRVLKLMAEGAAGAVNDEQAELLKHLIASNETMLLLINNLLEVYRFEKDAYPLRLEVVNLSMVLKSCVESMTPFATTRAISLETKEVTVVPTVKADSISLRRMVQNILDNAIKFSPNGGTVEIKLCANEKNITLSISDCGPGVALSMQSNLFDRLKRGKHGRSHSTGKGLGLYICKKILDAHNGKIAINSQEGKGAAFIVTLPIEQRTI